MKTSAELQELINTTETLIDSNKQLAKANTKAFELIKEQLENDKETVNYLQEEFQALSDKEERRKKYTRRGPFLYLKKKLTGK